MGANGRDTTKFCWKSLAHRVSKTWDCKSHGTDLAPMSGTQLYLILISWYHPLCLRPRRLNGCIIIKYFEPLRHLVIIRRRTQNEIVSKFIFNESVSYTILPCCDPVQVALDSYSHNSWGRQLMRSLCGRWPPALEAQFVRPLAPALEWIQAIHPVSDRTSHWWNSESELRPMDQVSKGCSSHGSNLLILTLTYQ